MPCAKCIPNSAKAKTVTVAKGQKGDAGAVFDLAPGLGSVSDKQAANGGVMACVKKAKTNKLNEAGRRAIASHYRGAARLAWFMPGSRVGINHDGRALSGFPGSVVNFQSRERNGSVWAVRPRRGQGRGADGTKSGVERRLWKFSKGASTGERSLAGLAA